MVLISRFVTRPVPITSCFDIFYDTAYIVSSIILYEEALCVDTG